MEEKTLSLKQIMQEVVRDGEIKILPAHFEKTYFHWVDNLRDWCISRQIWWGHRIPVWYKNDQGSRDVHVGITAPVGNGWEQDPDTLDTWFSSALWTWSTLVDPDLAADPSLSLEDLLLKSPDFMKFHPTTVMETGYDILFFWVARMILMTTYVTGSIPELEYGHVPFETVYLHGLVRTRDGRKMSKSDPDTMIDPLDMISKYGADALRLSMIVGQAAGADSRLYEEKIAGYRNFVNKLWNASRFILMRCEEKELDPHTVTALPDLHELSFIDRGLIHALDVKLTADVTKALNDYRLSEAGDMMYGFVWDVFCDWYLEINKSEANHAVLVHALRRILRLLHPFCPFVTEELWSQVKPKDAGMLIHEQWPMVKLEREAEEDYKNFQKIIDFITGVRKLRVEHGVPPGKEVSIITIVPKSREVLLEQSPAILRMGQIHSMQILEGPKELKGMVTTFLEDGVEVHMSLEGLIDPEKEKASLKKEQEELSKYVKSLETKLKNKEFVAKAPKEVIDNEKAKLQESAEKLAKIEEKLKSL